jgi:hypothetical protein
LFHPLELVTLLTRRKGEKAERGTNLRRDLSQHQSRR